MKMKMSLSGPSAGEGGGGGSDPFASDIVYQLRLAPGETPVYSDASANNLVMEDFQTPVFETSNPIGGSVMSFKGEGAGIIPVQGDNSKGVNFSFTDTTDISVNLDFTVEFWMQCLSGYGVNDGLLGSTITAGNRKWVFFLTSTELDVYGSGNQVILRNTHATDVNVVDLNPHHIAWTRAGTLNTLWVDGTEIDTFTSSHNYSATDSNASGLGIGEDREFFGRRWNNGLLDGIRITHACRYTGSFTPPTLPLPAPV